MSDGHLAASNPLEFPHALFSRIAAAWRFLTRPVAADFVAAHTSEPSTDEAFSERQQAERELRFEFREHFYWTHC